MRLQIFVVSARCGSVSTSKLLWHANRHTFYIFILNLIPYTYEYWTLWFKWSLNIKSYIIYVYSTHTHIYITFCYNYISLAMKIFKIFYSIGLQYNGSLCY